MHLEQEICNCSLPHHEYSVIYGDRLCGYQVQETCMNALKINGSYDTCQTRCHLGCLQTRYDVRLSGIDRYERNETDIHRATLMLSFGSSSVEYFRYVQTIGPEMVLGYIGSYIGIWAGVSLHGLFQIIHDKIQKWCCC
ncbi:uncharacterized protein LOC111251985 [Varroa destructor]|uniref:Uncharacterized protein n=1 Tax=Varroa destructor TaxID=109461 RepID=A0A7M7KFA8_VARDE|nr:uncharacterized protein LOC111251985 [Varroa destructor]